ncbi:hypothetical protein PBV87_08090 [Niameybacter massiliensis]|uniref:Uncharacterized protein n=1 Tax=Holtiella tumoricola TaxID=3018743 RepID=A0AA42J0H4_9FIRM|nr:hypothetical protein [Holtiella tumoricola]MDA3731435.1 hypothetical protein [Holtiella tumoricola]
MLIIAMNDLREYRLRYGVSQSAIANQISSKNGEKVSRQYINQVELGIGRNSSASEEFKKKYLQALYEIVQARQEK